MPSIVASVGRVELVPVGTNPARIAVQILDDAVPANPLDPVDLTLTISDRQSAIARTDVYGAPGSRIQKLGTGQYAFSLGVGPGETDQSRDFVFYWRATVVAGGQPEQVSVLEAVRVMSARFAWALISLRNYIDKSLKPVEPDTPLGYTDGQLALWLDGGLQWINAAQPYPVWARVDDFPDLHLQTLVEGAAVVGLTSQALFAVDTDVPSFVDNGVSFPLDHHPRLEQTLQRIAARLDAYIPSMKKQYIRSGALHVEMNANFRLALLVGSAPPGALFRNLFTS